MTDSELEVYLSENNDERVESAKEEQEAIGAVPGRPLRFTWLKVSATIEMWAATEKPVSQRPKEERLPKGGLFVRGSAVLEMKKMLKKMKARQ